MRATALMYSGPPVPGVTWRRIATAFFYILWRDVWVTLKDWRGFVGVTFVQPMMMLFVFGWLLPRIGQLPGSYTFLLFPGVIAMVILLTAMQAVSFPLIIDFGYTREIEDRLLAPIPVVWVGLAKIAFAALRGLAAGIFSGVLAYALLLPGQDMREWHGLLLFLVAILTALCGAAAGLALGTLVESANVSLVFSIAITPLGFMGCVYYRWQMLRGIRWFQVLSCLNPLTYGSEGLRAGMTLTMPHMPVRYVLLGQVISLLVLSYFGLAGFQKKAVQ